MTKNLFFVLMSLMLVVLGAQIRLEIPWGETIIPITGQSLGVLLAGAWFGPLWGTLGVFTYIVLGTLGLPIFAGDQGGWDVLVGPTGGYLIGFLPAAFLCARLVWGAWGHSWGQIFLAMLLATGLLLLIGVGRLAQFIEWDRALEVGFLYVLPGALLKSGIGALLVLWFPFARKV